MIDSRGEPRRFRSRIYRAIARLCTFLITKNRRLDVENVRLRLPARRKSNRLRLLVSARPIEGGMTPDPRKFAERIAGEKQNSLPIANCQKQESDMCLCHPGNESHPGHEAVPSRYATRIGDIEVLVISDGAMAIPADILGTNVDPAVRDAALRDRFLPDTIDWGLNVVVVRSGGRTILIDAGVGSEISSATRAGRLALRLEGAGIDPASITDVIATHIHMDHIGGLLDERLRGRMRPDLRVHVSGTDVEFFESPDFSHNTFGGIQDIIRSSARKFLDAYRSELRPFDKEHEVAPGVVVTLTGGHTPGHSMVRISSGGDRLTFAGDAVVPAGIEYPDWENAFDHEPEDATRVRVRLLREAARTGELFLASHLSFPSLGRVAAVGKAFRYVPANWAY